MNHRTVYNENKNNYNKLRYNEYTIELEEIHYKETFENARTQDANKYNGHQITYGELTYDGLENIKKNLAKHNIEYDNFIDIGCGKGRSVLHMSGLDNIKKSIGVELVSERVNHAKNVINKLKGKYKYFLDSAEIIEGDFTKQNYNKIFDKNAKIFIWISNLCFSEEVNAKILVKIQNDFGDRFVICCSKELPHNNKLKKIFVEPAKMTWDTNSKVHAYLPVY